MATNEVLDYLKNPNEEECKPEVVNKLVELIDELKSTDPKTVSMGIQKCKQAAATTPEQRTKIEQFQSNSTQRKKVSDSDLSKKINDIAEGKYDLNSSDFKTKIEEIEDIIERGKSIKNPNFSLAQKNFIRIKDFEQDFTTIQAKIKSDISTTGIEGLQALKTRVENLSPTKQKELIYDKPKSRFTQRFSKGSYTAFYKALRNIFNKTDAEPKITSIEKFGKFKLNYSTDLKFRNYEVFRAIYEVLENSTKANSNSSAEKQRMETEIDEIYKGLSQIPKDRNLIEKYLEIQNSIRDDGTKAFKIDFLKDAFLLTKIVDSEYEFKEEDGDVSGLIKGDENANGSILSKINILQRKKEGDADIISKLNATNGKFFNEIDKKKKELNAILTNISSNSLGRTISKADQQANYDKMKGFLEAANNNKMGNITDVKEQQEIFNSIKDDDFLNFLEANKSIPVPDLDKLQEIKSKNADKVKKITDGPDNLDLMIELREIVDNKYEFDEADGNSDKLILGDVTEAGSILKKLETLKTNLKTEFIRQNRDFINEINKKQKELANILTGIDGSKLILNDSKQVQQVNYKKMEGFLEAANNNKMGNITDVKEQQEIFNSIKDDDKFDFLITNAKNPVPDLAELQTLKTGSTAERINEITKPINAIPSVMLDLMIELREIVDNKYEFKRDDGNPDKLILGDETKPGSILGKLQTLKDNLGKAAFISKNDDFIEKIENKQKELEEILTDIDAITLDTGKSKEKQLVNYKKMEGFLEAANNNKMSNITVVKQKQRDFDTVSKVPPPPAAAPAAAAPAAATTGSSTIPPSTAGGGGGNGGSKKRPRKKHKKKTKKHKSKNKSKNKSKKHNRKSKRFSKKKKTKILHKKRRNRSIHKRRFKNNKITRHRHKHKYR